MFCSLDLLLFGRARCRRRRRSFIKVMFTGDDSQRRFLAQHNVGMLEQCCHRSKQCRSNVAALHCAKNRRCESSRVRSRENNSIIILFANIHEEQVLNTYTFVFSI